MKYTIFIVLTLALTLPAQARSKRHNKLLRITEQIIDEALIKTPEANEVCFSPENHCDIKLLKFIQGAKETLDIAIFDINLDQIVHEILVKSKTIKVRLIVDTRESKGKNSAVPLLLKAGVNVRYGRQKGIMHNKFAIVDGKMIETGSFNYTNGAAFKNNENLIYLNTPSIVSKYIERFEKIWGQSSN